MPSASSSDIIMLAVIDELGCFARFAVVSDGGCLGTSMVPDNVVF